MLWLNLLLGSRDRQYSEWCSMICREHTAYAQHRHNGASNDEDGRKHHAARIPCALLLTHFASCLHGLKALSLLAAVQAARALLLCCVHVRICGACRRCARCVLSVVCLMFLVMLLCVCVCCGCGCALCVYLSDICAAARRSVYLQLCLLLSGESGPVYVCNSPI